MMTFDDKVITDYGMVGRIGSIEDINGVTHYTVYFDDGAVKVFTADNIEVI